MSVQQWSNFLSDPNDQPVGTSVTAGLLVATRVAQASLGGGVGTVRVRSRDGVPPHVVYRPESTPNSNDRAEAAGCYAGFMNLMGTFDVPGPLNGAFWNRGAPFFQIDLGTAFVCPWPGTISLAGGRLDEGSLPPVFQYQMRRTASPSRIQRVMRVVEAARHWFGALVDDPRALWDGVAAVDNPMDFVLRPTFDPTFTFVDLPENPVVAPGAQPGVQLPLGVWAVQVPTVESVTFNVYGVDYPVVITPSQPIPIGFLAMGTVRATAGGGPIPLLACHIKLG